MTATTLRIGIAQIAPVWLHKKETINKVTEAISQAADKGCDLVAFGEGMLPGYPFWLSLTHGADFDSTTQKEIHAHYIQQSIDIEGGDLDPICTICKQKNIAAYLGTIERAKERGKHSLYCSIVYIDKEGVIQSIHRKLQPTYEERLAWAVGDGHGLRTHKLGEFCVGGLNCWENWMPLSRMAMYAQGENLRVAVWPGSIRNTEDITRFIALEGRSYVMSVSALMRKSDISENIPHADKMIENAPDIITDGGSCIANPRGEWVIKPILHQEGVFSAEVDINVVYQERQNLDVTGHYSRPDVTRLVLNQKRQSILDIE